MPIDPFALKNLFEALDSDISSSLALIKHSGNSPFAHRTYIRTLVSAVEAWVHATGQMLLHEPALHAVPLSPFEIAVLSDETYRVSSKGELEPRLGQPIPLPNRLRFIFRLTVRTYGSSYELDVSGRGWQCLNATVALRKVPLTLAEGVITSAVSPAAKMRS